MDLRKTRNRGHGFYAKFSSDEWNLRIFLASIVFWGFAMRRFMRYCFECVCGISAR